MEFKEYYNPEEEGYDINSSLNNNFSFNSKNTNQYDMKLLELIGFLEDITDEELIKKYGITISEYLNPTEETIKKVCEHLDSVQNHKKK